MSDEKQLTIDLIADVASTTEVIFEDGQTSTEWLTPYNLRLNVSMTVGPNGIPEVNIIGQEDDLNRFLDEQMPDVDRDFDDVR